MGPLLQHWRFDVLATGVGMNATAQLFPALPVPPPALPVEQPAGHYWLRVGGVLVEGSAAAGVVALSGSFPPDAGPAVLTAVRAVAACVGCSS